MPLDSVRSIANTVTKYCTMTSQNIAGNITDFEQSISVNASADDIFEFLADVKNVPQYLPTVKSAQRQQSDTVPGAQSDRIRTQGEVGNHSYDVDGHFRVMKEARHLKWGSDGENEYSGWMEVQPDGEARSQVFVHIHYAPRPEMLQRMAERSPGGSFESAMNEGINKTLESIKRICEGRGGKQEISANQ